MVNLVMCLSKCHDRLKILLQLLLHLFVKTTPDLLEVSDVVEWAHRLVGTGHKTS